MASATLPAAGSPQVLELRGAMLAPLADCQSMEAAMLRLRLHCTHGPATFWDLRPRLLQLVAAEHGEPAARGALQDVDAVFRRHWPQAPVSRPAPLR